MMIVFDVQKHACPKEKIKERTINLQRGESEGERESEKRRQKERKLVK